MHPSWPPQMPSPTANRPWGLPPPRMMPPMLRWGNTTIPPPYNSTAKPNSSTSISNTPLTATQHIPQLHSQNVSQENFYRPPFPSSYPIRQPTINNNQCPSNYSQPPFGAKLGLASSQLNNFIPTPPNGSCVQLKSATQSSQNLPPFQQSYYNQTRSYLMQPPQILHTPAPLNQSDISLPTSGPPFSAQKPPSDIPQLQNVHHPSLKSPKLINEEHSQTKSLNLIPQNLFTNPPPKLNNASLECSQIPETTSFPPVPLTLPHGPTIAPQSLPLPSTMPLGVTPQVLPNFSPPSNQMTITSEPKLIHQLKEEDKQWLSTWLASKNLTYNKPKGFKPKTPNISQTRAQIKLAYDLLKELAETKTSLENSTAADDGKWCYLIRRAFRIKEKLTQLNEIFDPSLLSALLAKLGKVKKKRERLKRQREEWKQEKQERSIEARKAEEKFDEWVKQEKEKQKQELKEKQIKEDADSILSEVRKKIQDMKKAKEKFKTLEKIRDAKMHKALQSGKAVPSSSDRAFHEKIAQLRMLAEQQLSHYEDEERALQVMMDVDHEAERLRNLKSRQHRVETIYASKTNKILESLFGDQETLAPEDPRFAFREYYNQATKSIGSLIEIRRQWDTYLVPSSHPDGSSIPYKWVVPPLPSSPGYAKYLKTIIQPPK